MTPMTAVVIEDTHALPIMDALVDCLSVELARSPGGLPAFCGVVPGALVTMDYCGPGCPGMAWVRLDGDQPSSRFPNPGGSVSSATDPTALRLQMGVTRCVATSEATGEPPSAEEQAEDVRVQLGDYAAMRRAVLCCYGTGRQARPYVLGAYLPIGPQGGCGGGAMTVTVQVL